MSVEDEKYPIMVIIQTKEIKKIFKKRSTLRKNIINLYRIIWGQYPPELHREL